jgi:hypothetical protein
MGYSDFDKVCFVGADVRNIIAFAGVIVAGKGKVRSGGSRFRRKVGSHLPDCSKLPFIRNSYIGNWVCRLLEKLFYGNPQK